ncbi:hypothetical protein GCM10018779_31820 [Streptomyces griseocarneus]|nr:hypothetical protein GCM10018779_31820 [Streptomyces griseocarneus]
MAGGYGHWGRDALRDWLGWLATSASTSQTRPARSRPYRRPAVHPPLPPPGGSDHDPLTALADIPAANAGAIE